ncbi:1,4-alpha-glucan branching protein domain-containing protein [Treponema sp.]|uniref:1,4-alpha-glucan branching protein domain-containing protein n=1 Tax=Treponema sp. TaxID=166 RepID=UPI00298DD15A|nr:1,4-alpha-glucan branching protein domain-containing protein [Treponema sp.]
MGTKNISLLLNFHHPYIRHSDETVSAYVQENSLLFEKITNIYIPLLNMLSRFETEKAGVKIAVVFSTPLCSLLSDPVVKKQYVDYLDNLIAFGKKEVVRTKSIKEINSHSVQYLEKILETKRYFTEVYEENLLKYFGVFAKKGLIEILATCGSYMFMPHFTDMTEILNAQVETGLNSVRHYFGVNAEGFYLPELGYTAGIEKVLRMYGVNYTILPSQSFLLGQISPEKGIFAPARCYNCLSLFATDPLHLEYFENPVYKNKNKDISWELELEELKPFIKKGQARTSSGFCYWNNSFNESELNAKNIKKTEFIYNTENAMNQVELDAEDFVSSYKDKLEKAASILKDTDVSMTCVFDDQMLYKNWDEGLLWFEAIVKKFAEAEIKVTSFSELLFDKFALQKITPYFASGSAESYGEDYLSSKNGWMIRYLRKACERIVDLAGRFPDDTGLKVRLLNLGSRELLLALSSEWAKMIENNDYAEYAEKMFKDSIISFTAVFDALGSNTVSTEWLCNLEKDHPIYPWMNFRIFSKKH